MKVHIRASSRGKTTLAILVMFALGVVNSRGFAEVKPGDMITMQSAARVRDLVSPGVYYKEQQIRLSMPPSVEILWTPSVVLPGWRMTQA